MASFPASNLMVLLAAALFPVEAGEGQMNERGALGVPECAGNDLRACTNYPKSDYYCTQPWMRINCPSKCGWCRYADPPPSQPRVPAPAPPVAVVAAAGDLPECKKENHRMCYTYKDKDYYCTQPWMQNNCAQYCNRCKFRVVKYARPPSFDVTDEVPGSSPRFVTEGDHAKFNLVCYGNEHRMCSYFVKYDKKFYCTHVWVRKHCRYMCGICNYI